MPYYSERMGKIANSITLEDLKDMFATRYKWLENKGYFQEWFGTEGDFFIPVKPGKLGPDVNGHLFITTKRRNLYPIVENLPNHDEGTLFDVIEALHNFCSERRGGPYASYTGNNKYEFNREEGQKTFRQAINPLLKQYNGGFEISENGEILTLPDNGLSILLEAEKPSTDNENINNKIDVSIRKYRRHNASLDERRDAIKELVEILEFIRPQLNGCIDRKDENDLFRIANEFGIRHHNRKQHTDYDKAIWYSWMFYYYLATIHAVIRMIERDKTIS